MHASTCAARPPRFCFEPASSSPLYDASLSLLPRPSASSCSTDSSSDSPWVGVWGWYCGVGRGGSHIRRGLVWGEGRGGARQAAARFAVCTLQTYGQHSPHPHPHTQPSWHPPHCRGDRHPRVSWPQRRRTELWLGSGCRPWEPVCSKRGGFRGWNVAVSSCIVCASCIKPRAR